LLLERTRAVNLTAIREPAAAWERLILGSLTLLNAHTFSGDERVADVGSGGGVPGIPLKLAVPGLRMTLIESDQKKAAFLRDAVLELGLQNVEVDARRAEEIGRDPSHRAAYDVVVTRAAAKPPTTVEYCMPLLRVGGLMLAQARGEDFRSAARAVGQLGGRIRHERDGVVVIGKGRPTPDAYPRRVGVPGKRPL
jgi:16S rRNA (guanine527-N7)-methyltransferase